MTIYLVRHGEAAASWQQDPDPGLSEKGRAQAEALLPFFSTADLNRIIASPLRRAHETALPLGGATGLAIETAQAFREIPTPNHIPLPDRLEWLQSCAHSPWEKADSQLQQWRNSILTSLYQQTDGTVIFTHFMVMNAVVGVLRKAPNLVCYQPDYCSVLRLEYTTDGLRLLDCGKEAESRVL